MNEAPVILLVEDDPDDAELTLHALNKCNLVNPIVVVRDGASALDYLFSKRGCNGLTHTERPALVLLDLQLPKVGGLEVLERIRADKRTHDLVVVVLTSSDNDEDILASYRLTANSYIQKPVNYDAFISAVKQVGLYWMLLNKPLPHKRD